MAHNKKDFPADCSSYDLCICGHSHKYSDSLIKGIRCLNPGSCGPRRFAQETTMAMMCVEDRKILSIEKIPIPHVMKEK